MLINAIIDFGALLSLIVVFKIQKFVFDFSFWSMFRHIRPKYDSF
mgnify:CR=1 FL=1